MITVEEALARILATVSPLPAERVFLDGACGRVLAEALVAERRLPPWDNSAMDGFAVRADEVVPGTPLPIAGVVAAGDPPGALPPGTAMKIMTGAPVPDGADAVVMREDAEEQHPGSTAPPHSSSLPPSATSTVRFSRRPEHGAHIRHAGEDVEIGARVLEAGVALGAGEIGLCAALGRTLLSCCRRPTVAILSTGDELVEADRAPGRGQIVASNGWALAAQCREAGALPTVLPIAADDRAAIREAFATALRSDVVISSGGVSVGDFDFVKAALEDLGVTLDFWRVAMKPGKPVAFGLGDGRPVFGLPGNPASSLVGFELFVHPALLRLSGHQEVERPRAPAILDGPQGQELGRRHYVRAVVRREGGVLRARSLGRQGSGMLRSLVGMNALLEIPDGTGRIEPGEAVTAVLLAAV